MQFNKYPMFFARRSFRILTLNLNKPNYLQNNCQEIPFVKLYRKVTGTSMSIQKIEDLKKKEPNISKITSDSLELTLEILNKFEISAEEACCHPHLFCMNIISMDNYGEILKECGFIKILPIHLIRYNTIVRSRTISYLKKESLLKENANLEGILLDLFGEWPADEKYFKQFSDRSTNILTIRMSVLERYLQWRLAITSDDFAKYCKHYLPLKHRPMSDIRQSLDVAENVIKFDSKSIKSNGFIISSDPVNTRLILEKVDSLAGFDIKEAIRLVPAILKNNYKALLAIKELMQEYQISEEAQRRCLRVFCMNPDTVKERLNELVGMKEYKVLSTNPRMLSIVVHQRKVLNRLSKIQSAKKQCFSLNSLVSSRKIFNTYISSFGSKVCSRDVAVLISSTLKGNFNQKSLINSLKRHKYWLHTAISVVHENISLLKKNFDDKVILDNCQILLYPGMEIEKHIGTLQKMRSSDTKMKGTGNLCVDTFYSNLNYSLLTDSQILSLVLYEIEKKYHFSGDGIWTSQDGIREHSLSKKAQHNVTS